MYKLCMTHKYYRLYNVSDIESKMVVKTPKSTTVTEFTDVFLKKELRMGEVDAAIAEMKKMGHNCAEFGVNGFFVVSYVDALVRGEA